LVLKTRALNISAPGATPTTPWLLSLAAIVPETFNRRKKMHIMKWSELNISPKKDIVKDG
jgi:hypothetical protein